MVTAEQLDGSVNGAVLEAEVVDLVGLGGEILSENVQRVAIVLVLFHQRPHHALPFFIVFRIHTRPYQLNVLNIRIELGNNLEHLISVVINKFLNARSDLVHFPFIRDVDLAQCMNLT